MIFCFKGRSVNMTPLNTATVHATEFLTPSIYNRKQCYLQQITLFNLLNSNISGSNFSDKLIATPLYSSYLTHHECRKLEFRTNKCLVQNNFSILLVNFFTSLFQIPSPFV